MVPGNLAANVTVKPKIEINLDLSRISPRLVQLAMEEVLPCLLRAAPTKINILFPEKNPYVEWTVPQENRFLFNVTLSLE